MKRLLLLLAVMLTAVGWTGTAGAAPGDILRTINVTPAPACGITVGIAYDGSELLVSCISNETITRANPLTGVNLGNLTITGMLPGEGIGAISWDRQNNLLWIGTGNVSPQKVYTAVLNKTLGTGVATFRFAHTLGGLSIIDGLAFDGFDGTVWLSPDVSSTVYHYSQAGALLGSFSVAGKLGNCGNSGLVVSSATDLYLANNGCSEIYKSDKAGASVNFFASLAGKRVEDLECDGSSFPGKTGIWSKDAFDYELNLFEVTAGECPEGGGPPADEVPPVCEIAKMGVNALGQKFLQVRVEDDGSGIKSILVTKNINGAVVTDPFTPGTTDPVYVTSTKIIQSKATVLALRVEDMAGNVTECDPVLADIQIRRAGVGRSGKTKQVYAGLPQAESKVMIQNGRPGIRRIELFVNGKRFALKLQAGATRKIDVARAMRPGTRNKIVVVAYGKRGAKASILISD